MKRVSASRSSGAARAADPAPTGTPFGPGSLTWRVNGEGVLLLGGGRALIMQVAHPKVAAGVAQHSDYRADPWGRLYRTLDVTLKIAFGTPEQSRAASERLRRRHSLVRGSDDRGESYEALDPELLMWVSATLIDTSLLIYERYLRPLGLDEKRAYYREMTELSLAYGIPYESQPPDYDEFREYVETMLDGDALRVTPALRDVADATLRPPVPLPARPVVKLMNLVTVGTLPERLRDELGLEWGPNRDRLLRASQATIRRTLPLLPGLIRRFPGAKRPSSRPSEPGAAVAGPRAAAP
jgi:uncharacterized protein (DUF2236 family)